MLGAEVRLESQKSFPITIELLDHRKMQISTKRRIDRTAASLVLVWMTVCFAMTLFSYYSWTNRDFFDYQKSSYSQTSFTDRMSLVIDGMDKGSFVGKLEVVLSGPRSTASILPEHRLLVTVDDLAARFTLVGSSFYEMNHAEGAFKDLEGRTLWEGEENERFYPEGDPNRFPFDRYVFGARLGLMHYSGEGNSFSEIKNIGTEISFRLKDNIQVRKIDTFESHDLPREAQHLSNREILEGEHFFIVERAGWYRWFVVFIVSLLMVPVYFITRIHVSEVGHASLGFLTVTVYVAAVRTLLLGDIKEFAIYGVDGIFLLVLFLIVAIPLLKIVAAEGTIVRLKERIQRLTIR